MEPQQITLDEFSTDSGHRRSAKNVLAPGLRQGGYLSIEERFDEWLETPEGKEVYGEVIRRALSLRSRGWKHYSVKAIVEGIRYDRDVRIGPSDGGFKINDHFSSRMARRAMAQHAELDGFFETRGLRAP